MIIIGCIMHYSLMLLDNSVVINSHYFFLLLLIVKLVKIEKKIVIPLNFYYISIDLYCLMELKTKYLGDTYIEQTQSDLLILKEKYNRMINENRISKILMYIQERIPYMGPRERISLKKLDDKIYDPLSESEYSIEKYEKIINDELYKFGWQIKIFEETYDPGEPASHISYQREPKVYPKRVYLYKIHKKANL
jgi:hypothetical protein